MKRKALLFEVILAMLLVSTFAFFSLSFPLKGMKSHVRALRSLHLKHVACESLPEVVSQLSQLEFKAITKEAQYVSLPDCGLVQRQMKVLSKLPTREGPNTNKKYKVVDVSLVTRQGTIEANSQYQFVVYEKDKPIHSH